MGNGGGGGGIYRPEVQVGKWRWQPLLLAVGRGCLFSCTSNFTMKMAESLCLTKHHAMKTYWGVEV
jgi:hypothetical protein